MLLADFIVQRVPLSLPCCSRRLGVGARGRRGALAFDHRCFVPNRLVPRLNRQHQLAYCPFRSLAHDYLLSVAGLRPLRLLRPAFTGARATRRYRRVALVSQGLIATMSRSDFSLRIRGLACAFADRFRSHIRLRTQRDLPRSRAVPFRPCQRQLPDRLSCRASGLASAVAHLPGRLPFTFVPAWSLSETLHPSASRPEAVFDYGGVSGHTSAPGWTSTNWNRALRGALEVRP